MTLTALHDLFLRYPIVSTDTRKIESDCLFFALKGPNFNGNEFAAEALEKGAKYAIIDEPGFHEEGKTILVENVLETLQKLAIYHRNHCKAKIISLTGSNGKTTTKELIHAVLDKKYRTIATSGNLNNHIGVPLTLLTIKEDTEIAIIEMGANHQGEIAFLSGISQPDYGYITNFGKAHLEGFGGVQGVIKGKSELYDYLMANDRYVFMNADDPIQREKLAPYIKKIGFSTHNHDFYQIRPVKTDPFVVIEFEGLQIETQLIGEYNFSNCAIAITVGKYFNVPKRDIKLALEGYRPANNRSEVLKKNNHTIVLDAYNANPTSMLAALKNFVTMAGAPKVLFLGDMFELGEASAQEHQKITDVTADLGFHHVYLIGKNFSQTKNSFQKFEDFQKIADHLKENPLEPSTILIKGSRGMALERLLDLL
ncbi:UDP-N-acetylmuramoyl-tripeptide--D-alanyl-D-alanine ligase [Allomuricauda sp. SCSIO 65647]|uniref:UDP-N-acetylmuramoyl-tripeptide--D-alanyl-D- alanine ligase n=1 Tax=Allomuricauda sp. SCSIO 65647 TaxID=2908843 RepID=UPI001F3B1959|nr:UDP-N-acetylmuramoyl-tripeptide--D-alanyl-D-alanine ligase [Muricauda sp. SCSIO 65647]UJH66502.1 UDP-N-acetylmuramoyl-tripeptide--D-alanyl-D-alanine ligase [Muricauda sp. SCSIO 65647]